MESVLWLNRTLIDLVFERRNKAYGAFDLRLRYERNMARAMLISIGLFITAWIGSVVWQDREELNVIQEETVIVSLFDAPPIQPPRPRPALSAPQPAAPQTALVTPTVVDNDTEMEEVDMPTQETLSETAVGNEHIEGSEVGLTNEVTAASHGTGAISIGIDEATSNTPAQLFEVDQKPVFPGGEEAMYKYLRNHLDYPDLARETKITGTVVVRFVVNAFGKVEQVEIMKSPSLLFNEEALDVIRNMPDWTPAKRQGKAVPTFYIIPLKFQLL